MGCSYPIRHIPIAQLGYRWEWGSPAAGLSPTNERWYPVVEYHLRAGLYPKDQRSAQHQYDQVWPVAKSYLRLGRFVNHLIVYLVHEDRYIVMVGNRRLCAAKAYGIETLNCLITTEWNDPQALSYLPYENVKEYDPLYTHR